MITNRSSFIIYSSTPNGLVTDSLLSKAKRPGRFGFQGRADKFENRHESPPFLAKGFR